jgi:hypothetical protein
MEACGTISFYLWGGLAGKSWSESKLKELEQQGFGMSHAGIHLKHLKKVENKIKYNF